MKEMMEGRKDEREINKERGSKRERESCMCRYVYVILCVSYVLGLCVCFYICVQCEQSEVHRAFPPLRNVPEQGQARPQVRPGCVSCKH